MDIFKELIDMIKEQPSGMIQKSERGFRFNPTFRPTFIQALRDSKVNFMCVDGDVTPYIVDYATSANVPILGYDSIYLGFDVKFCFVESL